MSLTGFRGLKNNIYNLERVNNLVGDNGSGKTSFLEALYLMCTGVSFLTKATETIANHATNQFVVEGIQSGTKESNKILVSYKQHKKTHFLNKQADFLCQFLNFNWPNEQKFYRLIYFNRFP